MKIDYIRGEDDRIQVVIEGVSAPYVNALRRVILSELPIYGCSSVVVYDNSSPLFDEVVSHRIGLVPLTTPYETTVDDKMVTISIEAEGPATVYSSQFVSDDPDVVPISDDFPIVKLGKGQRLSVNAECVPGFGKDHMRWQPGLATYKNYPDIRISENCNVCGSCVRACPRNILVLEDEKVVPKNVSMCTFCKSCIEACNNSNEHSLVEVIPMNDKFIFSIESFGCMSAKDLLMTALRVIRDKSVSFSAGIAD